MVVVETAVYVSQQHLAHLKNGLMKCGVKVAVEAAVAAATILPTEAAVHNMALLVKAAIQALHMPYVCVHARVGVVFIMV
jgi:hypothetical protein